MGRYYLDSKTTVEQSKDIDVFWLRKYSYFSGIKSGGIEWTFGWNRVKSSIGFLVNVIDEEPYVEFRYNITNNETNKSERVKYKVNLVKTACHYGGFRYWFICPSGRNGFQCQRRVAKLFLSEDQYFACRHCLNLSYDSRNKSRHGIFPYITEVFDREKKIRKLQSEIKITHRKGRPTKKYQQLQSLLTEYSDEEMIAAQKKLMDALHS